MPRINVLPPFAGGGSEDLSERVALRAAECAEMVKCSEILSALRLRVSELCRECDGSGEAVENVLDAFEKEFGEQAETVSGEKASSFLRDVCSELREELLERCAENEALSSLAARADVMENSINAYAAHLKDFPKAYADICADFEECLEASGLPDAVKEALYAEALKKFAASVLESSVGIQPDAAALVFKDARISEMFTEDERKRLAFLAQKRRDARDAYAALQRLKRASFCVSENAGTKLSDEYSAGLSPAASDALRVLARIHFRNEAAEERTLAEERLTILLSEIKKTFEEKGEEEAFALLISGETESLDSALYEEIRAAFENGRVGVPDGKKGFLGVLNAFSKGTGVSEKDALSAYLTGKADRRGFEVLSFLRSLDVGASDVFFFRKVLGELIGKSEENYAAAVAEAVAERFAALRKSGASLTETKAALDACIGG